MYGCFQFASATWLADADIIKNSLCRYEEKYNTSLILFLDDVHALGKSTPTRDSFLSWLLEVSESNCVRVWMMTSDEIFAFGHFKEGTYKFAWYANKYILHYVSTLLFLAASGLSNRLTLIHVPSIPENDIKDYLLSFNLDATDILKVYGFDVEAIVNLVHTVRTTDPEHIYAAIESMIQSQKMVILY